MLSPRQKVVIGGAVQPWYNVVRHYTGADSRPTVGRTNTEANRSHPPKGEEIVEKKKQEKYTEQRVNMV